MMRSNSWRGLTVTTGIVAWLLASIANTDALAQTSASGRECVPLAEQHPKLGTAQSVSARGLFTTVWGSFELPGGACGYASAEEHYNALAEDAKRRGGPTRHTQASLPDWSGHWGTENSTGELAIVGRNSTPEGMAARLTPEAREVYLRDQRMWDEDHAIDPISFCLPPNFPRWVSEYGFREHFVTPDKTLLGSEMMNEFRRVFTDGRPHPSPEWITNEWLGYSIGFWDGDVLTIWTKGLKEGVLQRNMPRQTNQMEVIERWRKVDPVAAGVEITPSTLGSDYVANERIEIELTMYDPTFVEPWHTVVAFYKEDDRTPEAKERIWPHQWDCVEGSQWYITEEGVVSQYAPGEKPEHDRSRLLVQRRIPTHNSRHADQTRISPCSGRYRAGRPLAGRHHGCGAARALAPFSGNVRRQNGAHARGYRDALRLLESPLVALRQRQGRRWQRDRMGLRARRTAALAADWRLADFLATR